MQPQADANPYSYDHDAAEDPLVELARIVSETGRAQPDRGAAAPHAPQAAPDVRAPDPYSPDPYASDPPARDPYLADPYDPDPNTPDLYASEPQPAAPRVHLPDNFADGLEAELMAELRPSYQEQPYYSEEAAHPDAGQPQGYNPADADYAVDPVRSASDASVDAPVRAPRDDRSGFGQGGFTLGRDTSFASPQAPRADPAPLDEPDYGQGDLYAVTPPAGEYAPEPAFVPESAFTGEPHREPSALREPVFTHERAAGPSLSPAPRSAPAREPSFGQVPEAPRDDVDDMAWPAAERAISNASGDYYADGVDQADAPSDDSFDDLFEPDSGYAPGVSPEHVLPPHSQAEREVAPARRSSSRGLVVVGSVVAVVALGAGGFLLTGLFGDDGPVGPAAVITADSGPFKVFPTEQSGEAASPSKAIYDRVGGVAAPRQEQLVSREEEPLATVPTTNGSQPRQVTGETSEAGEPVTANGLPRRVRTVVVRPDGTIINAPDEVEAESNVVAINPLPETSPPGTSEPAGVSTETIAPDGPFGADTADLTTGDTTDAAATDGATASGAAIDITPRPKPESVQAAAAPAQDTPQPVQNDGPLDLSGGNQSAAVSPAPAAQPSAPARDVSVPAGAYFVQISSQRTRDQAESSYASMQRRYPSVLGGVSSVIQEADLGDRGVFYRVRIVADSQSEANQLCESLKAAGGDCFVRRAQ
ncbi:SPOR domain-containing protein [Breoghania sp. L-A4]|uniref:SPOR domain-containing protein n=1 Tax=Breoghania sp. L-A4 TaxID=2304600 RepID=UPI0013C30884|nr:SPOR domain-containing protein [Breoghania sp. L-A4]